MRLNSIKPQLKPKALEGGISEFYACLKVKYPDGENLTYIKETPCVLGCSIIVRKLVKILSMQPGAVSNSKPQIFLATELNKVILEPLVIKEKYDWSIKSIKNTKNDLNSPHAVSIYNVGRKLSHLVAYDLNIDDKAIDKYLVYINKQIEYLDRIINQLGGEKRNNGVLNFDETPPKSIIEINKKRKNLVRHTFNLPIDKSESEVNLPDDF
jgi:hypothetical protein